MNTISVTEKLNTHKHGRDYHQKIGKIGLEIGMEYSFMNTIIRKLFDKNFNYAHKILALEPREVYAFVLNNADRLRHLVREAMAAEMAQMQLDVQTKSLFEFHIPQSCLFTYNGEAKTQIIYKKNVYQNYLSSAAPRSTPEVKFENSVNIPAMWSGGIRTAIRVVSISLSFTGITPRSKSCFIQTISSA